ncbi:hypothetical protein GCM10009547_15880 [Sporichthya brevicatena]|uniref:UspA domain-containing protein n=1 Tax=Sporichthya brevicatena TaxID=171442 RepID=A0ABN1GMU7_9ACTN
MADQQRYITVGVDGSEGGRRALSWAIRHAVAVGADVQVVTAWSWDGMAFAAGNTGGPHEARAYAEKIQRTDIDKVLSEIDGPVPVITTRVVEGHPTAVLVAASKGSELLVLGSNGRGFLASTLFGSVSESVVRRGSTPVLVVPALARVAVAA